MPERKVLRTESGATAMLYRDPSAAAKVSSPELASLAAKYVNLDADDLMQAAAAHAAGYDDLNDGIADIRRLAASVLSQAEGAKPK